MCKAAAELCPLNPLASVLRPKAPGLCVRWCDVTVEVGAKSKVVLEGVSGVAARGALTAVLGPSGSGKSTLLACVSCRFPRKVAVARGRVLFDGRDWDRSTHKRRVLLPGREGRGGLLACHVT